MLRIMKNIRLATVFSGIGAVEQAFKRLQLTHSIVFACDNDKFVKQSYLSNYPISEENWYNDIHDIDGKEYKNKVDILVGGSPCQSFSMVGKRKGLEDFRGLLIYEFMRLIKEIKPKTFIFENVKGLLSHDSGKTWAILLEAFEGLGYTIHKDVLNAKDFGIPQNRERLFVVGFKKMRAFSFPISFKLEVTMQDFLEDVVPNKYFLPEKGVKFVTDNKNLKKKYTQINGTVALCQKANQQFNWHGDFISAHTESMDKYFLSNKVQNYEIGRASCRERV